MKKHSFKIIAKKTLGLIVIASALMINSANAQATYASEATKSSAVKYLGTDGESFLFNVSYENPTGGKFSVIVSDAAGNTLFNSVFSDKKFDKRFKLQKEDTDKITFVIKNLKENTIQNFEINTTTRVVEDVVVKKVI